jgi:NAD(P)-dependent dehydrogenase (short-subunit alcohol dehydrogenase family)
VTKTALVTGASRGIGRAMAIELGRSGYAVAITARTAVENQKGVVGSLESTSATIKAGGGEVMTLPLDLRQRDALAPTVDRVMDHWGRLDLLVNNAVDVGTGNDDQFLDVDPSALERRLFVNLVAPLLLAQRAAHHMVAQGGGTIVNVTSGVATTNPTTTIDEGGWALGYGCSKGGLHRAAGIIALELGADNVRCYNLQPGMVKTERVKATPSLQHISKQGKDPAVVGRALVWLLSQPGDAVGNGRTLEVDEIVHLLPTGQGSIEA